MSKTVLKGLDSLNKLGGRAGSIRPSFGVKGDKFGTIKDNCLMFDGNWYKINYVGHDVIFLDTQDTLFGANGDEFPLSLIR